MLAYHHAVHILRNPQVRMMSLGTGSKDIKKYDVVGWTWLDWKKNFFDFMINIDMFASEQLLSSLFSLQAERLRSLHNKSFALYHRAQTISYLKLNAID